jgi:chromosome condensin MukBEF MukE localization factor
MRIEKITQYKVDGKLFPTLAKAQGHVDDLLGAFVDRMLNSGRFGPKDRLHVHAFLIAHKDELVELMTVELPDEEED